MATKSKKLSAFCPRKVTFVPTGSFLRIPKDASPLFVKLTEKAGREIQWNFTKFLINKDGEFVRGFGTQKKPEEIEEHIKAII